MTNQGYITIATGEEKYVEYAFNLRLSCIYNDPKRPFALLVDEKNKDNIFSKGLEHYFDYIILYKGNNSGLLIKLDLYEFSPFEETFFIDADSLMIKNPEQAWQLLKGKCFVVQGSEHFDGVWYGITEKQITNKLNISYLPRFNGGFYYFDKSKSAQEVFKKAKELSHQYEELGLNLLRGMKSEEPLIAIAMALCNIRPIPDDSNIMFSTIGRTSRLHISIPRRRVKFKKYGVTVSPIILHCCAELRDSKHYWRAVNKLKKLCHIK